MTPEQLQILQHSLGVDQYGRGRRYRNCFVTDPDCTDGKACQSLVTLGYMQSRGNGGELTGGMFVYTVTDDGVEAMLRESPAPPQVTPMTRSKRRYQEYLDADSGLTFKEWLTRNSVVAIEGRDGT